MNKTQLRLHMKKIRSAIPDRQQQSFKICENICKSTAYRDCEVLLVYLAIHSEVSLSLLIDAAVRDGKKVAIPLITGPHTMEFRIYDPSHLIPGAFHTWQPAANAEAPCIVHQKTLMIAPGLAFTPDGKRLGYGGGYYDNYLSKYNITVFGASFSEQIIQDIPVEEHDRRLDGIAAPGGIYDCICTGNPEKN